MQVVIQAMIKVSKLSLLSIPNKQKRNLCTAKQERLIKSLVEICDTTLLNNIIIKGCYFSVPLTEGHFGTNLVLTGVCFLTQ
jgi:hypothetical protein